MIHNGSTVEWKVEIGCHSCCCLVTSPKSHIFYEINSIWFIYLSYYQGYKYTGDTKMLHSGTSAEWKVGMGYLGYIDAMIIHDM